MDIKQILDELSARFGATGSELWVELVKYQVAGAWFDFGAFALILAVGLLILAWAWAKADDYDTEPYAIVGVCISIVGGVGVPAAAGYLVRTLASPQAAVIHNFLGGN